MSSAYGRKKDPERVRQALIDSTAELVIEVGLANVTVAGVAARAGVTKGALFHHFDDRNALITAMFESLLDRLDHQLDHLMTLDPHVYGRFTRAYVNASLTPGDDHHRAWRALFGALIGADNYTRRWYGWLEGRLRRDPCETDPALDVVRLAADGAWLAATMDTSSIDFAVLRL